VDPVIRKVRVTDGVFWIEIPEADLRILCGCPADVVKHLMKRGLVTTTWVSGVQCETGPNAILLSDLAVQNGDFANLSEFVLLQIFYRQGLLVPGHPNNTGVRPLLIGLEQQVRSQRDYIYRGNYGLVSEEEILSCGVDRAVARDLMHIKRAFAFGELKRPDELIDVCPIAKSPVEIRNGVVIEREGLNRYVFTYGEHREAVDLNLGPHAGYPPPFHLGIHRLKRHYFAVTHSGEGDGWDATRPGMASVLTFQGRLYLIDAGANVLHSLSALGVGVNEIDGVFHTHVHDDHFAGLAGLFQADHRLRYFATPLVRAAAAKKLAALMSIRESSFSEYFDVVDLPEEEWTNVDGLEVMPRFTIHPVETSVFYFRALTGNGYRTYAHLADTGALDVIDRRILSGLPEKRAAAVRSRLAAAYFEPADLKKIDIGGGLIHGVAQDFVNDHSAKIVLSHVARDLTLEEKEIGSSASFGMQDVLIPALNRKVFRDLPRLIRTFFPQLPDDEILLLDNCPLRMFTAGSILIRKNEVHHSVYLLVSGLVEVLDAERGVQNLISRGSAIGEWSGLAQRPSPVTYRSKSYVELLQVSRELYTAILTRNDLRDTAEQLYDRLAFVETNRLLGDNVSTGVQVRLAEVLEWVSLKRGERIEGAGNNHVWIVVSGKLTVSDGTHHVDAARPGDVFGEEAIHGRRRKRFSATATKATRAARLPARAVDSVPVIRWRLFELHQRRLILAYTAAKPASETKIRSRSSKKAPKTAE
jgi:hemerythrin